MNNSSLSTMADLILCNARVITMDAERPYANLVAIRGDRILSTGDKDALSFFKGAGTKVIDCQGGTAIPGFNDAHCHPISHAINLLSLDCTPGEITDIQGIQKLIHQAAKQTKKGRWIRAVNYDEFHLKEKRPPNRYELDLVCPENPVIVVHRTAGNCILNSLALKLTQPFGNTVHRNPENGEPDGLISGRNEQVEKMLPIPDEEEIEKGMKLVNLKYLSLGITSVQDTSWNNKGCHWQTWKKLIDHGIVSQRVTLFLGTEALKESESRGLKTGSGYSRLQVGGIKLALDESTGNPHPPQQEINQMALQAYDAGFRVAFHVSDIPMLEASLAAIKFIRQVAPGSEDSFRLEHCAICPPSLLLRIKATRAIVVTQPSFIYYFGQKYLDDVPSHQTNWFQPIGSFNRWGIKVAFSSDSPLSNSNPLAGIYAAVTRKTEKGQKLAPQEGISLGEALRMYTQGGADASSQNEVLGSISPGKFADLAVLNGDITQTNPEQIPGLKVVLCIINGKVAWEI